MGTHTHILLFFFIIFFLGLCTLREVFNATYQNIFVVCRTSYLNKISSVSYLNWSRKLPGGWVPLSCPARSRHRPEGDQDLRRALWDHPSAGGSPQAWGEWQKWN